ncbi:GNAT family N-acetyltransferase [Bacillus cereus]|nr:GNAT family N-acetyltransferase [Bacillus cereus]PGU65532.1 GNAT family N-acetyltransferase [Bacillus cereus]
MKTKPEILINIAMNKAQVVGYKIGYELNEHKFCSWLDGVHTEFRGHGIASELMKQQHAFLKEKGYRIVQTKTKNKWRNMLILNIKNGFNVIGTYTDDKGEPKIILEKNLYN